jgi:hypothetical protein
MRMFKFSGSMQQGSHFGALFFVDDKTLTFPFVLWVFRCSVVPAVAARQLDASAICKSMLFKDLILI